MDFCLKSHWHWQLGALHNANRQGRKALEEKHGRWKYCAEVPVAWRKNFVLSSQGWETEKRNGIHSLSLSVLWCKLALSRLTGRCPGWMTHMCFSLACLGVSFFPAWGFSVPRVLDQHTHPLKRSGCEKVPELPLPRQQWASQLSPSLMQLLRWKVRISRSCVQIRAAETCSSAPLEMCENANQVQVSGGFRCSNKEFSACFFLVGQESTRLQLCCFDRLVNVRAGITGGSCGFGSWTLSVYDRTAEVHWETISALFIVRH